MLEVEKFIMEVKNRPILYNANLKDYNNREVRAKLWEEIAEELCDDWQNRTPESKLTKVRELQTKWKSLRDHFRKELVLIKKNKAKKRKYLYFDFLKFLTSHVERKPLNCSNNNEEEEEREETESKMKLRFQKLKSPFVNYTVSRHSGDDNTTSKKECMESHVTADKEDNHSDKMGNKAFCMSLVPIFDKLPETTLIDARLKIMQVLQKCYLGSNHSEVD